MSSPWAKQWFLKGSRGTRSGACIVASGINYFFFDETERIEKLVKTIQLPDAEPFKRVLRPTDKERRATYQTPV